MKKSLVLLIGLLTCLTVASQPIGSNAAKRKAMRFMRQEKLMLVAQSATDNPTYYVFNSTDRQRGFVIVSGEESTDEILGYADSGTFDPESMPEALRWWLQCYDEQIKMLRSKKATAVTATTSKKAISPLVATKWGQNDPFNNQSPVYKITYNETTHKNDTTYYVTGCVATAMAQIMKYWSYNKATAAIPAYTSYTRDIERPALPATTFNYAAMKNAYNSKERGAAVDAVAKLMKYCGQSVEMDYNTGGSSASMSTESFTNYFGYDTGATIVGRATYTTSEWEDIIYNELAAKRPVLYSGKSPTSGHAFICDGYDGNGLFHINWGWSGSSDGYFKLSVMNPYDKGTGGGTSYDGYTRFQTAIVGLQPNTGNPPVEDVRMTMINMEASTTTFTRSSSSQNFNINFVFGAYNNTKNTYSFDLGFGIYQNNTRVKESVWTTNLELKPSYGYKAWEAKNVSFGSGITNGTYLIKGISRKSGTTTWKDNFDSNRYYLKLTINGNTATIEAVTATEKLRINSIKTEGRTHVNRLVTVSMNITNQGNVNESYIYLFVDDKQVSSIGVALDPGATDDFTMHYVPKEAKVQSIRVCSDNDGSIELARLAVTIVTPPEPNLTVSNVKVANAVETSSPYIIRGTTFNVTCNVKNVDTYNGFNDEIEAVLYKYNPEDGYGWSCGSAFSETFLAPGEQKQIEFSFKELINGGRYWAVFYTYDSNGSLKEIGRTYSYTIDGTTGISPVLGSESLNSPSFGEGRGEVPVYDLQGRKVSTTIFPPSGGLRGAHLTPGIYIVNGKKVAIK